MGFLSSLWKAIKSVVSKIVDWIIDFIKEYWLYIVVLIVVWYAPQISGYLGSIGAPAWAVSAFAWVGTAIAPTLWTAGAWAWEGITASVGSGWSAFKAAEFGTKISILTGAGMLIAPEETAALLKETTKSVLDVTGDIISSVGAALANNPLALVGAGLAVYFLFFRKPVQKLQIEGGLPNVV